MCFASLLGSFFEKAHIVVVDAVTKGKCECVLKQNKHRLASSTLSFVPHKKMLKTNKKEKNLTKSRKQLLTNILSKI